MRLILQVFVVPIWTQLDGTYFEDIKGLLPTVTNQVKVEEKIKSREWEVDRP